jgi:hypothetical protein
VNLLKRYIGIGIYLFGILLFLGCSNSKRDKQSLALANQTNSKQTCIHRIIILDDSLGRVRNRICKTTSLSSAIRQYINAVDKFDLKNCPKDFIEAYKNHIQAWSDILTVTDQYPDLRGEMHDLFDELETGIYSDSFKTLLKLIWDTWKKVENYSRKKEALDSTDCTACERIYLFAECTGLVNDNIWKGLNDMTNTPPLLYFTDSTTYIAFLKDETLLSEEYHEFQCSNGLLLKKTKRRLDAQPFHMENKMSFSDTSSMFYYRPMMLSSDVETMIDLVPDFTKTEDWLPLVMHEYFHSFQFSHFPSMNYLASTIQIGADTLDKIYQQNDWFQTELAEENRWLLKAVDANNEDSLDYYLNSYIKVRENRRDKFKEQSNFELTIIENFWETVEGTARYTEYYLAGSFKSIPIPDSNNCDSLFQNFADYTDGTNFENKKKFRQRTKIMVAYYYVTGFNLCRVMDKLGYTYKPQLFDKPEKGLYDIFIENFEKAGR